MQDQAENAGAEITHLEKQFEKLSEKQLRALRSATFLGMTAKEAKTYNSRRRKISDLAKRLSGLLRAEEI